MNPFKLKASLLLLLGGLMTASTSQAALTYTPGDIFLGFRSTDTNVTQSYLVNIGAGSSYRDATATFQVAVGTIASDLGVVFGSGWATDPKVIWGVVGTNSSSPTGTFDGDPTRTLYSSLGSDGTIPLADLTGLSRQTSASQFAPAGKIITMKDNWLAFSATSTATAANAAFTTASDAFSYTSLAGAAVPFGYFSTGMEGNFGNGAAGTSLDLFRTAPRVGTAAALGSYEGTFTLSGSGTLTFNVVPEPTGVVCLALTGLAFGARRRRPAN